MAEREISDHKRAKNSNKSTSAGVARLCELRNVTGASEWVYNSHNTSLSINKKVDKVNLKENCNIIYYDYQIGPKVLIEYITN